MKQNLLYRPQNFASNKLPAALAVYIVGILLGWINQIAQGSLQKTLLFSSLPLLSLSSSLSLSLSPSLSLLVPNSLTFQQLNKLSSCPFNISSFCRLWHSI